MAQRETYYIEIDLDQIPGEFVHTFNRRDGSAGAKVKLQISSLRNADQFGNTHTVYLYRTKEERENGIPVKYVGKGKILYNGSNATTYTKNEGSTSPRQSDYEDDPGPF